MIGRFAFGNRSGGASPLSRQEASQPKALLTIAGALPHPLALLVCAAICIVANIAIWRIM
jgi:hypothetical protein